MDLKNIIIGIAIIILTIFVVVYGINTFYEAPDYDDFCEEIERMRINNSADCEAVGGFWDSYSPVRVGELGLGSCDETFTCRTEYSDARESYSKTIFWITLPLGIIIIVVGALIFGLEAVGAGLMGGGVGIILWGVGSFWQFADNWVKFLLSLLGLVVVIWLAYYFNKRLGKKKKK